MISVYLLIGILSAANAGDIADKVAHLNLANCKFASAVVLSYDNVVAQLDCTLGSDANKAILEEVTPIEGVAETQVVSVVRPH